MGYYDNNPKPHTNYTTIAQRLTQNIKVTRRLAPSCVRSALPALAPPARSASAVQVTYNINKEDKKKARRNARTAHIHSLWAV